MILRIAQIAALLLVVATVAARSEGIVERDVTDDSVFNESNLSTMKITLTPQEVKKLGAILNEVKAPTAKRDVLTLLTLENPDGEYVGARIYFNIPVCKTKSDKEKKMCLDREQLTPNSKYYVGSVSFFPSTKSKDTFALNLASTLRRLATDGLIDLAETPILRITVEGIPRSANPKNTKPIRPIGHVVIGEERRG